MTRLVFKERDEELEEVDEVEDPEERRSMGAGVGARLRIESDLRRDPEG